jgi:hypothetical protein
MPAAWIPAVIGAVGAIGGGIASGSGASGGNDPAAKQFEQGVKRLRQTFRSLEAGGFAGFSNEQIFGTKADSEAFNPIDLSEEQMRAILANQGASGPAAELSASTNEAVTAQALKNFETVAPGGSDAIASLAKSAGQLNQGKLPFDDVLDITRLRGGAAAALGIPGTQIGGALPRDLGLSRLDAIAQGASLTAGLADIAGAVSPISRQLLPQNFYVGPGQALDLALRQATLDQVSRQNAAIAESLPDPIAQGIFNLDIMTQTARLGQASVLGGNSGTDFSAIGDAISDTTETLFGKQEPIFGKNGIFGGGNNVSGGTGITGGTTNNNSFNIDSPSPGKIVFSSNNSLASSALFPDAADQTFVSDAAQQAAVNLDALDAYQYTP